MTYKQTEARIDRLIGVCKWFGVFLILCWPGRFIYLALKVHPATTLKESDLDTAFNVALLSLMGGVLMWVLSGCIEAFYKERRLAPIRNAWEKRFENPNFLLPLVHGVLADEQYDVLQKLFSISRTTKFSVSDVERAALASVDIRDFWVTVLEMLVKKDLKLCGPTEYNKEGEYAGLCVGENLLNVAKEIHTLDNFEIPEQPRATGTHNLFWT